MAALISKDPTRLADEDLLALVGRGDARAFEIVYDRHSRVAFSLAFRLLGDRTAAEDLVQDAFLAVWRGSASYAPARGSVRNWLLSILHNRGIDRLRTSAAMARRQEALEQVVLRQPHAPDAADLGLDQVLAGTVREGLRDLPPEQREALDLAYYGGFTHQEIAEMLELPLGTVKSRMRLGLERLRRGFGEVEGGEPVTREHDAVRGLLAPAAVSAATASEIARVEAHAEECPVCREDLARLREGADVLALAVPPAEPSPRLKRELMATVRSEAALRAPHRAPARRRRPAWLAGLRSWPAALAATAAVALVMIGWNVALQTGDDGPGPGAEVTSLAVSGAGGVEGRVLYLPDEDQAIVTISRLPQPGEGQGYELWVIRDGRPASAGFLQEAGPAEALAVASDVRGADALAVTLEPLTNRAGPTTDPVVAVDLPQRA